MRACAVTLRLVQVQVRRITSIILPLFYRFFVFFNSVFILSLFSGNASACESDMSAGAITCVQCIASSEDQYFGTASFVLCDHPNHTNGRAAFFLCRLALLFHALATARNYQQTAAHITGCANEQHDATKRRRWHVTLLACTNRPFTGPLMDRRLQRPLPFRKLLLAWLWESLDIGDWRSEIIRPRLPQRVGLIQLMGAAATSARISHSACNTSAQTLLAFSVKQCAWFEQNLDA